MAYDNQNMISEWNWKSLVDKGFLASVENRPEVKMLLTLLYEDQVTFSNEDLAKLEELLRELVFRFDFHRSMMNGNAVPSEDSAAMRSPTDSVDSMEEDRLGCTVQEEEESQFGGANEIRALNEVPNSSVAQPQETDNLSLFLNTSMTLSNEDDEQHLDNMTCDDANQRSVRFSNKIHTKVMTDTSSISSTLSHNGDMLDERSRSSSESEQSLSRYPSRGSCQSSAGPRTRFAVPRAAAKPPAECSPPPAYTVDNISSQPTSIPTFGSGGITGNNGFLFEPPTVSQPVQKENPNKAIHDAFGDDSAFGKPINRVPSNPPAKEVKCEPSNLSEPEEPDRVKFGDFITEKRKYLACEFVVKMEIGKIMGACFDEERKLWVVSDMKNNKITFISTDFNIVSNVQDSDIQGPTAVCVLKPNFSIVILCNENILVYEYAEKKLWPVASELRRCCRGLAVTPNGNVVTTKKERGECYIELYHVQKGKCNIMKRISFDGMVPCFICTSGQRLLISDLGNQHLTMVHISDEVFENTAMRVIANYSGAGASWDDGEEPKGKFSYVSGVHLDSRGFSIVADAAGRTLQMFNPNLEFKCRLSVNFDLPYSSAMAINKAGQILLCGIHEDTIYFAQLKGCVSESPNRPNSRGYSRGGGGRRGMSRGGGYRGGRGNFF